MSDTGARAGNRGGQGNRLCALLAEVELLLSHLQRLPDTRLARYFGDEARQRHEKGDGGPVPPTWDQVYFLDRLAAISAVPGPGQSDGFTEPSQRPAGTPPVPAPPDPGSKLNDLAFLFWSRDFLAAITYPASVESIRVTRAFRTARARRFLILRALLPGLSQGAGSGSGPAADDMLSVDDAMLSRYGVKLANRVTFLSVFTGLIIVVLVWASFMVFSGRVLIRENDALQAARKELTQRISLADKDERRELSDAFHVAGGAEPIQPAWYCALSLPPVATASSDTRPETMQFAMASGLGQGARSTDASAASVRVAPLPERVFLLPSQRQLCMESDELDKRESELKDMHSLWLASVRPLSFLVLRLPTLPFGAPASKPNAAALSLATHRYGMEQMVDGLIGAILPVAYAWLGTLAALFRRIGLKAETETLSAGDYGAMRTSMILGLLAGTVIGLFSDVIGWGDQHGTIPLGTTALALLAGFAADRVFVLLDTVAERVFGRPAIDCPAPPPGRALRVG